MKENTISQRIYNFIKEKENPYRLSFIATFIMGLLTHMYIYTNNFVNQDGINSFFKAKDTFISGRWFLEPMGRLFSNMSLPWLNGVVAMASLGIITCVIVNICNVKSKISIILISLVTVTFPSITAINIYIFVADAYIIALMFAALSVYLADKGKIGIIASIVLLTLSIGTYQINLFFAISLYTFKILRLILENKNFKDMLKKLAKYITIVVISFIVYFIATKIINRVFDISLVSYKNIDKMGDIKRELVPDLLKIGRIEFFKFFNAQTKDYLGIIPALMNKIVFIIIVLEWIIICFNKTIIKPVNKVLLTLLIILAPRIFSFIYILNSIYIHHIMLISFVGLYYLVIQLSDFLVANIEGKKHVYLRNTMAVALLIISISWGIFANEVYTAYDLKNRNMYALTNRLVAKIEEFDDYNYTKNVMIMGNKPDDVFGVTKPELNDLEGFTGIMMPYDYNFFVGRTSAYLYNEYVRTFIGVDLKYPGFKKELEIGASEEFKSMPIYPEEGSIKKIDDIIIIKISEREG
ncbi:glucosyltransferase domain-containing protein [Peptostreptococcaceae bacterium OttesenSCG-928-C18]|nr:glucosyltransferase domain-containing protein [Peptostreptococcaceae bacterium OttesenSCG-928-C18]